MQEIARRIAKVSKESKLPIDEDQYVASFKVELMDAVMQWCRGASFSEICKVCFLASAPDTQVLINCSSSSRISSKEVLSPARVKWYVPSGVHDDVGLELAAVVELEASLREALDLAVVLDFDLTVDDFLAGADV